MITKYPPPRYRIVAGEIRTIAGFGFDPEEKDVESILKIKSEEFVSSEVRQIIYSMRLEADDLVRVRAVYGIFVPDEKIVSWFPGASYIALSIVSIGYELEERSAKLEAAGHVTQSLVLDAWGSAFTEGAVMAIDHTITEESRILGCSRKKRRSPGFYPWLLDSQKNLFTILPAETIKVSLTKNMMMTPRKSVSFGVGLFSLDTGTGTHR